MTPEIPTAKIIDTLFNLREQKRILDAQLKDINQQWDELKSTLVSRLQDENIHSTSTGKATATLTEQLVPTVTDWNSFYTYIKENDAFYMLERRASASAWRELHNAGQEVPGTAPFTKFDINLRAR